MTSKFNVFSVVFLLVCFIPKSALAQWQRQQDPGTMPRIDYVFGDSLLENINGDRFLIEGDQLILQDNANATSFPAGKRYKVVAVDSEIFALIKVNGNEFCTLFNKTTANAQWTVLKDSLNENHLWSYKNSLVVQNYFTKTILQSLDKGQSWKVSYFDGHPITADIRIFQLDSTLYMADYYSSKLFRSDDAATTWLVEKELNNGRFYVGKTVGKYLYFTSEGYDVIFRFNPQSHTPTEVPLPSQGALGLRFEGNDAVIYGYYEPSLANYSFLYHSNDMGETWLQSDTQIPSNLFFSPNFRLLIGDNNVFSLAQDGLYQSNNFGNSFQLISRGIQGIGTVNTFHVFGEKSSVLHNNSFVNSQDIGFTWGNPIFFPTGPNGNTIEVPNTIQGYKNVVLALFTYNMTASWDGGTSWMRLNPPSSNSSGVYRNAYVGKEGLLGNYGDRLGFWTDSITYLSINAPEINGEVKFINNIGVKGDKWVFNHGKSYYLTKNKGTTWSQLSDFTQESINALFMHSHYVYNTSDIGISRLDLNANNAWENISSENFSIKSFGNLLLGINNENELVVSTNDGVSFENIDIPLDTAVTAFSVDDGKLFIGLLNNGIWSKDFSFVEDSLANPMDSLLTQNEFSNLVSTINQSEIVINIVDSEKNAEKTIQLFNISGQLMEVYNGFGGQSQISIPISNKANGVYWVNIKSTGKSNTFKFYKY
jgi:Secretion system C-terminal sorting domain